MIHAIWCHRGSLRKYSKALDMFSRKYSVELIIIFLLSKYPFFQPNKLAAKEKRNFFFWHVSLSHLHNQLIFLSSPLDQPVKTVSGGVQHEDKKEKGLSFVKDKKYRVKFRVFWFLWECSKIKWTKIRMQFIFSACLHFWKTKKMSWMNDPFLKYRFFFVDQDWYVESHHNNSITVFTLLEQ